MCCGGCGATGSTSINTAISDGTLHLHAHSHAGETISHERASHSHEHGFRWRTLLVGLMHGMAGSAALLVLTATQAPNVAVGLGYVALFGIGSMIGMGALSTVIAVPIALSARWLTWANRGLQGAVGLVTIAIGLRTIAETAVFLTGDDRLRLLFYVPIPCKLTKHEGLRVRLTASLAARFNPRNLAFD